MSPLLTLLTSSAVAFAIAAPSFAQGSGQVSFGFAEDADPADIEELLSMWPGGLEYALETSWPGNQGEPISLTWSLVPDGLSITDGINSDPSELFARLDLLFASVGGRATWLAEVQACFDRWEEISGVDFTRVSGVGVDWDDGAAWGTAGNGASRGDVRVSMKHTVPGLLVYALPPLVGDVVLESQQTWDSASNQYRSLRNSLMHGIGTALGIGNNCCSDSTQLMEGIVPLTVDGPQQDDFRAVQRHYGDPYEPNNDAASAVVLPPPSFGVPVVLGVPVPPRSGSNDPFAAELSLDNNGEQDWFRVSVSQACELDATLQPIGSTYSEAAPSMMGGCPAGAPTNALAKYDLRLSVYAPDGTTQLASVNSTVAGFAEVLTNLMLPGAGDYFLVVDKVNTQNQTQLYQLTFEVDSCPLIATYCTSGTSTNGCVPAMSSSGSPSVAASSGFTITASSIEGQKTGLIFYGINGPHAGSWAPGSNSYLCVKTPTQRTPSANSGGTAGACDGAFAVDFLDYIATHGGALGTPFSSGDQVWLQAWYRDPAAPGTTNLTGGITWVMCP